MKFSVVRVVLATVIILAACSSTWAAKPVRWQPASERPQVVRKEVEQILADRSYNHNYPKNGSNSLTDRVNAWIRDVLMGFLSGVNSQGNSIGKTLSYALAGVVILAFGVLAFFLFRMYGRRRNGLDASSNSAGNSFDFPESKPLIAESKSLAGSGNYREAFRLAYLASIAWLDEAKALRFDKSRTNWEYMRDLEEGGFDTAVGRLRPLTVRFDQVIYGHTDCRPVDYEDMARAFDSIVAEVERG